jgi:hypothetical protein
MVPGVLRKRRPVIKASGTERHWCYEFPTLVECRRDFDRLTGEADIPDGAPTEWQADTAREQTQGAFL